MLSRSSQLHDFEKHNTLLLDRTDYFQACLRIDRMPFVVDIQRGETISQNGLFVDRLHEIYTATL